MTGEYGDATPFTDGSVDVADKTIKKVGEKLQEYGFQSQGWERMYNGTTGEPMESLIFIGPTYYQRLKHMVDDKMHARAQGHVTMLTRQPLEGVSLWEEGFPSCMFPKIEKDFERCILITICQKKKSSKLSPWKNTKPVIKFQAKAKYLVADSKIISKKKYRMVSILLLSIYQNLKRDVSYELMNSSRPLSLKRKMAHISVTKMETISMIVLTTLNGLLSSRICQKHLDRSGNRLKTSHIMYRQMLEYGV
jgi:hypothetical protein